MPERLATQHRLALMRLSGRPARELRNVLAAVADEPADVIRDALLDTVPAVAETYGEAAGVLAADYYDQVREVEAAPGRYRADPSPTPGTARYTALVRWGVDPLYGPNRDLGLVLSKVSGGLQRSIADVDRRTVIDNAARDRQAVGWRRVARPDGCQFCRMLADRGAVYSETTVRFASHDYCHCAAAPSFDPNAEPAGVEQYRASRRRITDVDRQRLRAYLNANY